MLPTFSLTLAEDVAYAHEYARRWRGMLPSERADGDAFLAALDTAEAEVRGERMAGGRCTGTLWAAGEDGAEVVDHDGDCAVHALAEDDGQCKVCGEPLMWSASDEAWYCPNMAHEGWTL